MRKKEDCIISLFDTVEEFNSYCILYKKKYANTFPFSNNVFAKNQRNDDIKEFKKTFNSFLNKLKILKRCILEDRTDKNSEGVDVKPNNAKKGEALESISNEESDPCERSGDIECTYGSDKNLNNERSSRERGKRKMGEGSPIEKENKAAVVNEHNSVAKFTARYKVASVTALNKNLPNSLNNLDLPSKCKMVTYPRILDQEYSNSDYLDWSSTNTDASNENIDRITNETNDVLIKYVCGLDYALNVRRVSRENLIEEIKEFYRMHNSNIRLNEYSTCLSHEIFNILKRRMESNDGNTRDKAHGNSDSNDIAHFCKNYENLLKRGNFFFYVPSNYFFIKTYDELNEENLHISNCTNYEKSLVGVNTCTLSNNSSSVSGKNYHIYTDSILSRNNSYNKCSSPTFGVEERQSSPNFGPFDADGKDEYIDMYIRGSGERESGEHDEFRDIPYPYNVDASSAHSVEDEQNGGDGEYNQEWNKCPSSTSKKYDLLVNSSVCNLNSYNNADELTESVNKTELDYPHGYEINNIENKKSNMNSNTSDFYRSISYFYQSKEKKNNYYEENNNNAHFRSYALLNSNETTVHTNKKIYHEKENNIINLYFDDELSNAITLNNESCLSKDINTKELHLYYEDIKEIENMGNDYKEKNQSSVDNKITMQNLVEYEKEEKRWIDEYCNGDYNAYRSKQLKKKKDLIYTSSNKLTTDNAKDDTGEKVTRKQMNVNVKNGDSDSDSHTILDRKNMYDNTYNVINLKIMYETNKIEFYSKEEMNFFPGQVILNKYKVVKILSKTMFSTTLKCLNMLYRKGTMRKDTCRRTSETGEKNDYATELLCDASDIGVLNNDVLPILTGSKKKTTFRRGQNESKSSSSDESLLTNRSRKKDCKYVCLKVMRNGKSFFDQGLFELIILNMLSKENNELNDSCKPLTNKNIIQLYDYFYLKEHLIIVTEYMQSDLYNYFIKKGKLGTLGQLQVLAKNLLQGLAYIHSKKLIHCDLKPENIMISMKRRKKAKKGECLSAEKTRNGYNTPGAKIPTMGWGHLLKDHNGAIAKLNYHANYESILRKNGFKKDGNTCGDAQGEALQMDGNFLAIPVGRDVKESKTKTKECVELKTKENIELKTKENIELNKCDIDWEWGYPHGNHEREGSINLCISKGDKHQQKRDNAHLFSSEKFDKIKIIDFNSSIYESDRLEMYVQTRSYRSPEVLLQQNYDRKIDIWSLGCILFEFLTKKILFDHQNIYRFIYSIVSYIGPFPFYMINGCKIPHIFTKHGLLIVNKIIVHKNDDNYVKPEKINEIEDEQVIFNSKDFFRLNKEENNVNDLLNGRNEKNNTQFLYKQRNLGVYYDVCYPSDNLLKSNFHIGDLLFIDFLLSLLQIDPCKRPNSIEALNHPWLKPNLYQDGL
ncbi:serine/threonine protein kinase, putative (SRPK2) [Plasmodium ovale curtisi]|uniref:Serine/threonine protein kinase, putative (SRPK2) n=1 Tax=Plasmodium ovale curtisi TaxID=864141 RepID=A0A1A8WZ74_PLAOA|nr:serine/threonine protein kinase, putative (SRPK2) [Plasmodium ovale curtisi]SBS97192.1 serine/threonine protein kinase, putative (SRPK2) [Plasmodium ovale curtisi]